MTSWNKLTHCLPARQDAFDSVVSISAGLLYFDYCLFSISAGLVYFDRCRLVQQELTLLCGQSTSRQVTNSLNSLTTDLHWQI